ncbi:hypothetical protein TIFTF001_018277 [Ficus carica]|uniref:Uncharacterized protein n=1 Tax=Ficus carica TaxID=3494 RepID=A0AA88DBH9_FICCA|nr:hypothetical protein TIFTF001_018277 [Ficus carica]
MSFARHSLRLLDSDEFEPADPLFAEQLGDADHAGLAPVRAVAGEYDVGAAEGEVLRRHDLRAVGEDVVVALENKAGESGGGDDDDGRDSAESEEDDRAEPVGDAGQRVVGHVGEQVKVADDRKASRRRRLNIATVLTSFAVPKGVEDKEESGAKQDGEEERFRGEIIHFFCREKVTLEQPNEELCRHKLGAAEEDVVVGLKNEIGKSGVGDDDGRDLAESEEDDRAESVDEAGQGVVGHVSEQVKVADDRKASRRRRLNIDTATANDMMVRKRDSRVK